LRAGKGMVKSLLLLIALSLFSVGLKMGTNEVEALGRLIAVSILGA
jgi:hypothetical protein